MNDLTARVTELERLAELTEGFAKLAVSQAQDSVQFYGLARQFFQKVSDWVSLPLMLGIFTKMGQLVIPFWAAPQKMLAEIAGRMGFEELEGNEERLNDLVSLMMLQKYRMGVPTDAVEANREDSETQWLFPVLCERPDHLIHAKRKAGPNPLGDLSSAAKEDNLGACLRRSIYACTPLDGPEDEREFTTYTPWFGDIRLANVDPLDECVVIASSQPGGTNHGWATYSVCAFPILKIPGWKLPKGNPREILLPKITPIIPHLKAASATVAHQLRMQVTSENPRYTSRFFQIVFGESVLNLLLEVNSGHINKTSVLGKLICEAATSLFDGRAHPVAARRLARELGGRQHTFEAFQHLVKKEKVQEWLWPHLEGRSARSQHRAPSVAHAGTKIVVAGSPRGGVGKTFLSYHLACSLARRKQRVLLIELDAANPTVFFIDSEYRHQIRHKTDFETLVKLSMDPVAAVRAEALAVGERAGIEELRKWTCKLQRARIDVLGAIPGMRDVVHWLSHDAAHGEDRRQMNALLKALKESDLYDWVIVDTAAGFRDLTNAVVLSPFVDLLLACSFPTKSSVLSTMIALDLLHQQWSEEKIATRCILVLNECRDMDKRLFKDESCVEDFVWNWANNGGDGHSSSPRDLVGVIPPERLIERMRELRSSSLVEWDEFAARLEMDADWNNVFNHEFGMDDLLGHIEQELGVVLPDAEDRSISPAFSVREKM